MKKYFIIFLLLFLLSGCDKKEQKIQEENDNKYEQMQEKLIEYGKLVYENDQWLNQDVDTITSVMTLKDLYERNHYDISMFVNPVTGEQCDLEKTKIVFILSGKKSDGTQNYKFEPYVDCGE